LPHTGDPADPWVPVVIGIITLATATIVIRERSS
jgi:hypothetical protein